MTKPDKRVGTMSVKIGRYIKTTCLATVFLANPFFIRAQTQVTINGASSGSATLYLNSGANLNVQGSVNVVNSGGGVNNYIQNNGTIQLTSSGVPGQSNISNGVSNLKTYTTGKTTGTVVMAANNETETISGSGSTEFMNLTTSNTSSPTLNLQQDVTIDGVLTIGGATAEINATTLTLNGTLSGSGTFTGSGSSNLSVTGSGNLGSAVAFASGAQTLQNFTINRSNASGHTVLLGSDVTVGNALTITNGILNLQGNNLTLPATSSLAGTPFSTSNMIQADGGGQFIRGLGVIGSNTSFTFPVGDGTPNYTPAVLTFASNTQAGNVGVNVTNSTEANNNNPAPPYVYLSRYWTFSNSLTGYTYTGTFAYPTANISTPALEASLKLSQWNGTVWSEFAGSSASANVLTETIPLNQTSAPLAGDFTGRKQCTNPTIFNVTGGTHCDSSLVGLSNSEAGVNYQLVLNGSNTGSPVAGTGSAITFGYQPGAGTYTAVATSFYGACTSNMNGSSVVNAGPTVYNVTGGACVPADMGVSGSDVGINYQLYRNSTIAMGSAMAGTGNPIDFGNQNTPGIYTVVATNATTGCTADMTGVSTVNICLSTWVGATSGDWFDQTNWNPAAVPNNCSANVQIGAGSAFQPVITGANVSVGSVTIDAGVTLTLSGNDLNVCGNWTGGSGNDAAIAGTGIVFFNSSTVAQTISGNTQFNLLQVNNSRGVTLGTGSTASIVTGLHLETGNLNVTAGTLQLLSTTSASNAYIDDFTSGFTGTIQGNITADRYVPVTGFNQHYISSPVAAAPLSSIGASGPDNTFVIPSVNCSETQSAYRSPYGTVFQYDDSHMPQGGCKLGNWQIKSSGNMATAKGYSAYLTGNSAFSLSGLANTGDITISGLNNIGGPPVPTVQSPLTPIESGWNLVGNPYPSTIDLTKSRTTNGFSNQVAIWVTSGPFSGTWQTKVIGVDAHIYIAPFQAFMVLRTDPGTGSYPFYQTERVRQSTTAFYKSTSENNLSLTVDHNGAQDATTVNFNPLATTSFDDDFDANKPSGSLTQPMLFTYTGGRGYSINTLPEVSNETTLPMGLRPGATGTMSITPNGIESFDPTTYIYLEDKQTATWHNLRDGAYTFTANTNDDQQRFVLHFTPPATILTGDASCSAPGAISVTQPGSAIWNYAVLDNSNTTVATGTLNEGNPINVTATPGVYTLTLTDANGYTVTKNIQVGGSQGIVATFTASATAVQTEENISFTNTSTGAVNYQWDFGDGTIATGTTASHSYTAEGVYTVALSVTNQQGCTSVTTHVVTVTSRVTTGINEAKLNSSFNIWSHDNRVFIDFGKQAKVDADIELYNVLGQLISHEKFGRVSIYSHELSNIEAGYIIVRVKNLDIIETKKVFIINTK